MYQPHGQFATTPKTGPLVLSVAFRVLTRALSPARTGIVGWRPHRCRRRSTSPSFTRLLAPLLLPHPKFLHDKCVECVCKRNTFCNVKAPLLEFFDCNFDRFVGILRTSRRLSLVWTVDTQIHAYILTCGKGRAKSRPKHCALSNRNIGGESKLKNQLGHVWGNCLGLSSGVP